MGTLKIKKVDDKPMVIHTKKKAKIHMHEPKKAKIKGSNIYTVQRGPKIASAKINDTGKKKSYRKSTIHQAEKKEKEPSKFKRNIRESNTSIKTKNTNLHIAGRTGALATGAVTEQVEGGQEVSQAAYLAYEASRPVTGTASRGASLFRKKAAAEAKRRIKKVETGKKLAKKMGKKAASDTAKKVAGDTTKTAAKETAKNTAKETAKTTTKAATTAAGTAVAPGAGTAVGMAAGYATGVSIEAKDVKAANRSRKIKFFLDKMKEQENQTDSVVKLVKDLIVKKAVLWIKAAAPIIGLVLFLLVLLVVIVAVPVIAVIAILYNSPFALFLPPLESGDTVQTVTSAYVSEFNRDVNTKVNEHTGYDFGELVYVDYEGMDENPSNYYDIMAVYMVKYGVGDTATIMNDISKGWLQTVVNDMCSYTTSSGTKDVEETDADGNVTTVTKSVLYVNVTLKSYRDMISVYGFDSDQVEMLEQIMSPEFMGQLGYAGSVPLMLLFTVLTSLGEGPWQGDMSAVIAQCSEHTYLKSGKRIDGSMFSCTSLGVKLGGGIGVALSGWLLDISGYINLDNAVQPDSCINMMYFMYLWLPFIFDIIITVILSFLNVESANMKLKENMQNQ